MCAILLALDEEACLPASNRFIPVCVYAKTRDLILLRSCYADAGETDLRPFPLCISSSLLKRFKQEASYAGDTIESEFPFLIK